MIAAGGFDDAIGTDRMGAHCNQAENEYLIPGVFVRAEVARLEYQSNQVEQHGTQA